MPRRRWHRWMFTLAGIYNISWGLFSAFDPDWLFRYAGMAPQNQPAIFASLAMVVGLYGLLYLEVARRPEEGWLIAFVGFTGKILGPIGLAQLIYSGAWPAKSVVLCLTNDFLWWIPFGLYLHDSWPWFRRSWSRPAV